MVVFLASCWQGRVVVVVLLLLLKMVQVFLLQVLLLFLALALHLGVFGAGLHPDGPGCLKHLKVAIIIILNNPE